MVLNWQQSLKINKGSNESGTFHDVSEIAVHPSGDIALIDEINNYRGGSRVYVFNPDGSPKFTIESTTEKDPVNKLAPPKGLAVTKAGHYVIADGTTRVKVYDTDGGYLDAFSTLLLNDEQRLKSATSVTVNVKSGDVLVGDYYRQLVTIHDGANFKLSKEVHVGVRPMHIAVNKKNEIAVTMLLVEQGCRDKAGGKVIVFDYSGDELFTIVPIMSGELARPYGLAFDSGCGLYVAVVKFDMKTRASRPDTGHIHYYNDFGRFVKCVTKGLHFPYGMGIGKGILAVADGKSAKVYKAL